VSFFILHPSSFIHHPSFGGRMSDNAWLPQSGSSNSRESTPAPSDEWQRLEQAYREIQRRDGQAE
jgi:hypothetical protein